MIYLNGQKLDFKTFPNGETLVNGDQIKNIVLYDLVNTIHFKYENDSDLIKLLFVKKHLDNIECGLTELFITYMPYSRMDRVEGDSVFTLKYISEFINNLKFDYVTAVEPHSDVMMALLDRAVAYYPTFELVPRVMERVGFNPELDYLMFPDQGSMKRYSKIGNFKTLVGYKSRDFSTGKITKLDVIGAEDTLYGAKVIIVDDLCSYGGTFYKKAIEDDKEVESGAAYELKKLGAAEIYLVVTHAEEAIYKGSVLTKNSPIDKVFTTNTIISDVTIEPKLEVFNIIT